MILLLLLVVILVGIGAFALLVVQLVDHLRGCCSVRLYREIIG